MRLGAVGSRADEVQEETLIVPPRGVSHHRTRGQKERHGREELAPGRRERRERRGRPREERPGRQAEPGARQVSDPLGEDRPDEEKEIRGGQERQAEEEEPEREGGTRGQAPESRDRERREQQEGRDRDRGARRDHADGPRRLVPGKMQRKDESPQVAEEDHAGVDGARPRPDVRQRVLHLEDPITGGFQETSERPAADEEHTGERGGGAGQDRKPARERAPKARPQVPLRDVHEEEEGQRGSRRAAFLRQHRKRVAAERRGEGGEGNGPAFENAHREAEVEEREDRRQDFPAPDEARHGFDLERVDREQESGGERGGGGDPDPEQERGQEQRRGSVQQDVDGVEPGRLPAVNPPLEGVRDEKHRPVGRAAPARPPEIAGREDLREVRRRLDPGVVAHDGLVVVGEAAADRIGVRENAGEEQNRRLASRKFRPGALHGAEEYLLVEG